MDDLVSIVVPIYKTEAYMDRCIESIVNQTYQNLEIILVDDGSPDHCPAMCDEWAKKDTRIQVVHKINEGLGKARNTGIERATGKYLFFFDSDDYVALHAVEACVNRAQAMDADTVVYGRCNVYSDGRVEDASLRPVKDVYEEKEITEEFLPTLFDYGLGYGVSAWSKMFSLHVIKKHHLLFESERTVISEDSIFCLEYFSKAKKVTVLSDRLYYYFKNEKSLTRIYKKDRQEQNSAFLSQGIDKIRELALPERIAVHMQARYHGMTLGTMRQIVCSDLRKAEKKAELRKIYKSDDLRKTLKKEVICLDAFLPRIFWTALKFRCYFLCDMFLLYKKHQ